MQFLHPLCCAEIPFSIGWGTWKLLRQFLLEFPLFFYSSLTKFLYFYFYFMTIKQKSHNSEEVKADRLFPSDDPRSTKGPLSLSLISLFTLAQNLTVLSSEFLLFPLVSSLWWILNLSSFSCNFISFFRLFFCSLMSVLHDFELNLLFGVNGYWLIETPFGKNLCFDYKYSVFFLLSIFSWGLVMLFICCYFLF